MLPPNLEVLLVEDDLAHIVLIQRSFDLHCQQGHLVVARSLHEAHVHLATSTPDVLLVDFLLPDGRGIELLPGSEDAARYPTVLMTSHGNEQLAVEAMKAGAVDYIVKSHLVLAELPQVIERALRAWSHITERRRAEEALRKLSYAVEQSPDMILITDAAGRIEYVNATFTRRTEYTSAELVGTAFGLPPLADEPIAKYVAFWQTVSTADGWRGEWQCTTRRGERYLASVSITPIRNAAEVLTHFLIVQEDITQAVRLQQRLRQAEKLASLGTMAAGLGHELNQPLTAIRVTVDSIRYGMERGWIISEERLAESLQLISEQCQRAAGILHDIRLFARDDTTRQQGQGLLQEGVRRALRLIGTQLKTRAIALHIDIPDTLPAVAMPQARIEQVLINLLTNAYQAFETIQRDTKVVTLTASQDGRMAVLRIADNGSGLTPEARMRLFDPFFTTKDPGEGSGLGLSIVHGLITDAGGEITVSDGETCGTAFIVRLPLLEETHAHPGR